MGTPGGKLTTREVGKPNLDMEGQRLIKVWVGTLTSDWIDVPATCVGQVAALTTFAANRSR